MYGIASGDPEKLILSAPLTHSDWMLRDDVKGVAWGPEGVKHMLDNCKACGWSRIYWRTLDGGRSLYRSELVGAAEHWNNDNFYNPQSEEDEQYVRTYFPRLTLEERRRITTKMNSLDYSDFDSLAAAVAYGHRIGLEVHAWVSINEDDHAWGIQSEFSETHPEYRWRRRNGKFYRSQISFAFPEAMEYKLGIVKELVQGYDIDGIFFDWLRTGDVRDNPQTDAEGVADHGYEEPLVEGFRAEYGLEADEVANGDERWVRFRSEPHTEFMRRVKKLIEAVKPHLAISMMGVHPWCYRGLKDPINGNLRGLLLDVSTWAAEDLIDDAVAGGYYLEGGSPEKAYKALKKETGGKVNVWLYSWVPGSVSDFERDVALANKVGAKQILFWEADYIDARSNKEELQQAMSKRAIM